MKKPSHSQLLENLRAEMLPGFKGRIVSDNANIKELKDDLVHRMNKYSCIGKQTTQNVQWYLGEMYRYPKGLCELRIAKLVEIAEAVGYELYSPNGYWFIKSK